MSEPLPTCTLVTLGAVMGAKNPANEFLPAGSTIKETVTSLAGSVGATVHATAQDETLKSLYAGYAYQYEQIAPSAP